MLSRTNSIIDTACSISISAGPFLLIYMFLQRISHLKKSAVLAPKLAFVSVNGPPCNSAWPLPPLNCAFL
jgi:hypothetical protein